MAAPVGTARVHDRWKWPLDWFRLHVSLVDFVEGAIEVELTVRQPHQLEDFQPFLSHVVTAIMLKQRRAEHLDLGAMPAADNIEREPAVADMIDGTGLFRGKAGMNRRNMGCCEYT
jgi:hypothetical protein